MTPPQILHPKPRRPYDIPTPNRSASPLLSPSDAGNMPSETPSRTHSILNLTSSTLLGIYSPTGYSERSDEAATPWGTGAQTPQSHEPSSPSLSNSLSQLSPRLRRKSVAPQFTPREKNTTTFDILHLGFRGLLLFGMGMGYGVLVRHLHNDRKLAPFQVEGIIKPRSDWGYTVFWGVAGVALGSLLPWFDTLFEGDNGSEQDTPKERHEGEIDETGILGADWTPVIRSIGAFVGIAYAIRRLPWASTMQVSLTLAMVNPALWYLVDRSKPGFILSTFVGCIGSAILLASNPDMMPSPASALSRNASINHTSLFPSDFDLAGYNVGGVVSRESIEGGIWILSVLFCSCVCFGNIGRRLALRDTSRKNRPAFASRVGGESSKRR